MTTLSNDALQWNQLSKRFGNFCDTLLVLIQIDPNPTSGHIEIRLRSRDLFSPEQDLWRTVILRFEGVESFSFAQASKTTISVISHGVHTIFEKERVGFEFGELVSPPSGWEELRSSPLHVIAQRISIGLG